MAKGRKAASAKSQAGVLLHPLDDPIDLREMVTFRLLRIAAKLTQGFIKDETVRLEQLKLQRSWESAARELSGLVT